MIVVDTIEVYIIVVFYVHEKKMRTIFLEDSPLIPWRKSNCRVFWPDGCPRKAIRISYIEIITCRDGLNLLYFSYLSGWSELFGDGADLESFTCLLVIPISFVSAWTSLKLLLGSLVAAILGRIESCMLSPRTI